MGLTTRQRVNLVWQEGDNTDLKGDPGRNKTRMGIAVNVENIDSPV
jgi:hypothetical protein